MGTGGENKLTGRCALLSYLWAQNITTELGRSWGFLSFFFFSNSKMPSFRERANEPYVVVTVGEEICDCRVLSIYWFLSSVGAKTWSRCGLQQCWTWHDVTSSGPGGAHPWPTKVSFSLRNQIAKLTAEFLSPKKSCWQQKVVPQFTSLSSAHASMPCGSAGLPARGQEARDISRSSPFSSALSFWQLQTFPT